MTLDVTADEPARNAVRSLKDRLRALALDGHADGPNEASVDAAVVSVSLAVAAPTPSPTPPSPEAVGPDANGPNEPSVDAADVLAPSPIPPAPVSEAVGGDGSIMENGQRPSVFPFTPLTLMAPGVVGFSPKFLPVDPGLICVTTRLSTTGEAVAAARRGEPINFLQHPEISQSRFRTKGKKSAGGGSNIPADFEDGPVVGAAAIVAKAEESYHGEAGGGCPLPCPFPCPLSRSFRRCRSPSIGQPYDLACILVHAGRDWVGLETLAWLLYAIENAHRHAGLKAASLRLLAQVEYHATKWACVTPINPKEVLDRIQATAAAVSAMVCPEMMAYRRQNNLALTLGVLTLATPAPAAQLVQRGHLAIFDPELKELIAPMTGTNFEYETNLIALLVLICQYIMPMWDAQTGHVGDKALHRLPRETLDRSCLQCSGAVVSIARQPVPFLDAEGHAWSVWTRLPLC